MTKIIFVDIDGVFNRLDKQGAIVETIPAPGMKSPAIVDLNIVYLFGHVVSQIPDLRLVASSTWREEHNFPTLEEFVRATFLPMDLFHEDWKTITLTSNRGLEITEWLHRHEEIEDYRIVDDTDDGLRVFHGNKFIQTDHTKGLDWNLLNRLIKFTGNRVVKSDLRVATLG